MKFFKKIVVRMATVIFVLPCLLLGYERMYYFFWLVGGLALKILFRVKVLGRENLPQKENFIVIAPHLSYWDVLAVGKAVGPRPLLFVKGNDNNDNDLGIFKAYTLPIHLPNPKVKELRAIYQALENGKDIVIFPEGAIDPAKQKLHWGVIKIAEKTQKRILPVNIVARGPYGCHPDCPARLRDYLRFKTRLTLFIKRPVKVEEVRWFLTGNESRQLAYQKMIAELMRLCLLPSYKDG